MSKYIPGNQKQLSLEDRKYIARSLNNGCSFKDIARFLCKDPTTISKEVKLHRIGIIKDPSLTLATSAFTDTTAEKQMYAEKSYSATLSVLSVQPVTKPAPISLKNSVTVLIRLLTSAMDVQKPSIIVLLLTSSVTMLSFQEHFYIHTVFTTLSQEQSIINLATLIYHF